MAVSDALQMARKYDKKGQRTLGVFTKIDIMDKGTDVKGMITGKVIKLRLGYVGVKGRSQQDIKNNVNAKKGLELERKYFSTHPVYSSLPKAYFGT